MERQAPGALTAANYPAEAVRMSER
jgi:hypothetical protein